MADEIISNLEPIEDADLNLEKKFKGEEGKGEVMGAPEAKVEAVHSIEGIVERKEGNAERESSYSKILAKISPQKTILTSEGDVATDAQSVISGMDAASKITNLVRLAETKSIPHAVKVARHMEDNYALDEFHDKLLGEELHSALVKSGMIREF